MKIRYMILLLASLFAFGILTLIGYFASFAITVIMGLTDVSSTDNALVNQGIFSFVRYLLVIVFCGLWYYRENWEDKKYKKNETRKILSFLIKPANIMSVLLFAAGAQIFVDSILYLLNDIFPKTIANYKELVGSIDGSGSIMYIIMTFTLGPIAEELIFRGLCLGYLLKAFPVYGPDRGWLAISIQALLFGLFHGNIVQVIYGTLFGLLFGIIAVKTKNLLPSILIHMLINLFYYPASWMEFNDYFACTAMVIIGIVMLLAEFVVFLKSYDKYFNNDTEAVELDEFHSKAKSKKNKLKKENGGLK
ncbi:MAG: CPBP family intramembrane metalloprotease [Eubacterium sp.]|nr:CPBP family intramembrane metalloprotease [Eubacterium sp.]